MVNSGSFDSNGDRNEKAGFTQPHKPLDGSQSSSPISASATASCKTDCSQTADSDLPSVAFAIEPTPTKTENSSMPVENFRKNQDAVDNRLPDVDFVPQERKSSVCCSVPLDKVQGVLTTYHPADCTKAPDGKPSPSSSRKLLCLYCDRTFVSANLRQKHVERSHSTKQIRRVSSRRQNQLTVTPCVYCDKLSTSEHTLTDLFHHLIKYHSNKYFGCISCEDRFLTPILLADHNASIHTPESNMESKVPTPITLPKIEEIVLDSFEDEIPVKVTRSKIKTKIEDPLSIDDSLDDSFKRKKSLVNNRKSSKLKEMRSKKLGVKSSKIALKRSKRLQAQAKEMESQKKKRDRRSAYASKLEQTISTKTTEKSKSNSSCINPYPEFDNFYRVKKITDHSIDNLKISSLTFDDVFDKAFFNRITCNIEENLLHHIDGKLFKNEESESRISNFEKISNIPQETQNSSSENYGCELSLNAVTPVASLSLNSQFGEDFESQIEYGSKPSKKKTQIRKDEVHYKYFTRRKYQASILEHKENRDLSKLDMWTQLVIKNRQQKMLDAKKSAKEILEYTSCEEYKNKMKRTELNRILDRRGPFEDLKEEASKKAALDKLNSSSESSISEETFSEVREVLNNILNKVFEISEETGAENCEQTVSPKNSDQREIPCYLNLRRTSSLPSEGEIDKSDKISLICSSQETENFELPTNRARGKNEMVELTGEWARSRMFICAACGAKLPNLKYLLEHKGVYHQNVWVQHYEFVGNQSELYRHLSIPALGKVGAVEESVQCKFWGRSDARMCTKCGKQCNSLRELHRHILECGGDWTWMLARKKCKYRPFGAKSRRKRRGLIRRIHHKQKTEPSEKKIYKKRFEGPRQRPSDADTIQRMLANLPAKRSRRNIISLQDVIYKSRKKNNQSKSMCSQQNSNKNLSQSKLSTIKSQRSTGRRSLRSLNKVLSSRILDTNTTLRVKRKLNTLNGRRITRQSIVEKTKHSNVDVQSEYDLKHKNVTPPKSQSPKKPNKIITEREDITPKPLKRVSPRSSPKNITTKMSVKKILTTKMNIKNFFPVKKKKQRPTTKENDNSEEIKNAISKDDNNQIILRNKRTSKENNEVPMTAKTKETGLEKKEQENTKLKKGGFKALVETLSLRKRINKKSNIPPENKHNSKTEIPKSQDLTKNIITDILDTNRKQMVVKKNGDDKIISDNIETGKVVVAGNSVKQTQEKMNKIFENKKSNKKRKLKRSFRSIIDKVKKIKIDNNIPQNDIQFYELSQKNSENKQLAFLGKPLDPKKEKCPHDETLNVKENAVDGAESVPVVTSLTDSKENPPIPETIFNLNSNNEKNLQAKGELDFDNQCSTGDIILSTATKTEDIKKVDKSNDKTSPITIETSIKPKVVPLISPNMKGKIKKPCRGLNDCIAMLTSKLQQKEDKSPVTDTVAPSTSPKPLQKSECILRIPTFKVTAHTPVEETALDLSKSSVCFEENSYIEGKQTKIKEVSTIDKVIEDVIDNKCKEMLNEKLGSSWNTVDDTIQDVIDDNEEKRVDDLIQEVIDYHQKPIHENSEEKTNELIANRVNDTIEFVVSGGKNSINKKCIRKVRSVRKSRNKKTVGSIPLTHPEESGCEKLTGGQDMTHNKKNTDVINFDTCNEILPKTLEVNLDNAFISIPKVDTIIDKTVSRKVGQARRNNLKTKNTIDNKNKNFPTNKMLLETDLDHLLNVKEIYTKQESTISSVMLQSNSSDNAVKSMTKDKEIKQLSNVDEPSLLENKDIVTSVQPKLILSSDSEDELPLKSFVNDCKSNSKDHFVKTEICENIHDLNELTQNEKKVKEKKIDQMRGGAPKKIKQKIMEEKLNGGTVTKYLEQTGQTNVDNENVPLKTLRAFKKKEEKETEVRQKELETEFKDSIGLSQENISKNYMFDETIKTTGSSPVKEANIEGNDNNVGEKVAETEKVNVHETIANGQTIEVKKNKTEGPRNIRSTKGANKKKKLPKTKIKIPETVDDNEGNKTHNLNNKIKDKTATDKLNEQYVKRTEGDLSNNDTVKDQINESPCIVFDKLNRNSNGLKRSTNKSRRAKKSVNNTEQDRQIYIENTRQTKTDNFSSSEINLDKVVTKNTDLNKEINITQCKNSVVMPKTILEEIIVENKIQNAEEPVKIIANKQKTRRKSKSFKKIDKIENNLFEDFSLVINKKTKRIPPTNIVDDSVCDDVLGDNLKLSSTQKEINSSKRYDHEQVPQENLDDSVEEMDMEIDEIPVNSNIIERDSLNFKGISGVIEPIIVLDSDNTLNISAEKTRKNQKNTETINTEIESRRRSTRGHVKAPEHLELLKAKPHGTRKTRSCYNRTSLDVDIENQRDILDATAQLLDTKIKTKNKKTIKTKFAKTTDNEILLKESNEKLLILEGELGKSTDAHNIENCLATPNIIKETEVLDKCSLSDKIHISTDFCEKEDINNITDEIANKKLGIQSIVTATKNLMDLLKSNQQLVVDSLYHDINRDESSQPSITPKEGKYLGASVSLEQNEKSLENVNFFPESDHIVLNLTTQHNGGKTDQVDHLCSFTEDTETTGKKRSFKAKKRKCKNDKLKVQKILSIQNTIEKSGDMESTNKNTNKGHISEFPSHTEDSVHKESKCDISAAVTPLESPLVKKEEDCRKPNDLGGTVDAKTVSEEKNPVNSSLAMDDNVSIENNVHDSSAQLINKSPIIKKKRGRKPKNFKTVPIEKSKSMDVLEDVCNGNTLAGDEEESTIVKQTGVQKSDDLLKTVKLINSTIIDKELKPFSTRKEGNIPEIKKLINQLDGPLVPLAAKNNGEINRDDLLKTANQESLDVADIAVKHSATLFSQTEVPLEQKCINDLDTPPIESTINKNNNGKKLENNLPKTIHQKNLNPNKSVVDFPLLKFNIISEENKLMNDLDPYLKPPQIFKTTAPENSYVQDEVPQEEISLSLQTEDKPDTNQCALDLFAQLVPLKTPNNENKRGQNPQNSFKTDFENSKITDLEKPDAPTSLHVNDFAAPLNFLELPAVTRRRGKKQNDLIKTVKPYDCNILYETLRPNTEEIIPKESAGKKELRKSEDINLKKNQVLEMNLSKKGLFGTDGINIHQLKGKPEEKTPEVNNLEVVNKLESSINKQIETIFKETENVILSQIGEQETSTKIIPKRIKGKKIEKSRDDKIHNLESELEQPTDSTILNIISPPSPETVKTNKQAERTSRKGKLDDIEDVSKVSHLDSNGIFLDTLKSQELDDLVQLPAKVKQQKGIKAKSIIPIHSLSVFNILDKGSKFPNEEKLTSIRNDIEIAALTDVLGITNTRKHKKVSSESILPQIEPLTDIITSSDMDIAPVIDEIDKSLEIDDIYDFNEEINKNQKEKTRTKNKTTKNKGKQLIAPPGDIRNKSNTMQLDLIKRTNKKGKKDNTFLRKTLESTSLNEIGNETEQNPVSRRNSVRSAKVKALENIHDEALTEVTKNKRRVLTSTQTPADDVNELNKNKPYKKTKTTLTNYDSSIEQPEFLENSAAELVKENKTKEDFPTHIKDTKETEGSKYEENTDDQTNEETGQELRRSRRGSKKVASYNENDLIDPLIDALEYRRKTIKKDKSPEKAMEKKLKVPERKLNSDELFDLLKSNENENIYIPKPQNSFLNNLEESNSSRDFNDENFDNVFENILEKSSLLIQNNSLDKKKDIDKIYDFTESSPENTEMKYDLKDKNIMSKKTDSDFESEKTTKDVLPVPEKESSLKASSKDSTSETPGKSNYCEICNKSFIRTDNLIKHKRTLTHISKLSEMEAKEAEEKAKLLEKQSDSRPEELLIETSESSVKTSNSLKNEISIRDILQKSEKLQSPTVRASFSNNHSLKLADIINDVLNKPVLESLESEKNNFSDIILQNTNDSQPEFKRYKSLGERKSFDSDKPLLSNKNSPIRDNYFQQNISKTTILEKQISLLENIIENQTGTISNFIDDISMSSHNSLVGSLNQEESSNFTYTAVPNDDITKPSSSNDRFLKPTHYEEISEDSIHVRNYEDQKLRKTLNRDEELFLECCSLLKSGSEVSSYSKKSNKLKLLNSMSLKQCDEPDWFEKKHLLQNPEEAQEYSDNSRTPTPLGDTFDDDASNSNTISSNWNMKRGLEDNEDENGSKSFNFKEALHSTPSENNISGFVEMLSKTAANDQFKCLPTIRTTFCTDSTPDEKKEEGKKVITKGARKVFEGLKVSIPTEELDLKEVLSCNPISKKLNLDTTASINEEVESQVEEPGFSPVKPPRSARKSKPVKKSQIGSNVLFKVNKKKITSKSEPTETKHDIYDFEETQDNTDVFTKPDFRTFRNLKNDIIKDTESDNESQDYTDSIGASAQSISSVSSTSYNSIKRQSPPESITKKKCMIMGRIFKNAAKSKVDEVDDEIRTIPEINNTELVENYVLKCTQQDTKRPKLSEKEIDMLFDQLLGGNTKGKEPEIKPNTKPKQVSKTCEIKKKPKGKNRKRPRGNSESSGDEFNINKTTKKRSNRKNAKEEDNCINLEQELRECIGVASRKSQRKCTSGKQNILLEYWSSDEEAFEALLETQKIQSKPEISVIIEAPSTVEEQLSIFVEKEIEKKTSETVLSSKPRRKKSCGSKKTKKVAKKTLEQTSAVASTRRKRAAANPLYHWSSSSEDESQNLIEIKPIREEIEDEDRPIQHGWIVGDSPKKLVTMLALTKGKKTEVECVKEQGKKRTSAVS